MQGRDVRILRITAQLTGEAVCRAAAISRTRLSEIERGVRVATADDLVRITKAIDDLAATKERVEAYAAAEGWPVAVLR
jgi:transcriptional regulator with XRE-family HTH domain